MIQKGIRNLSEMRKIDIKSKELKDDEDDETEDHTYSKLIKEDIKQSKIKCSIVI